MGNSQGREARPSNSPGQEGLYQGAPERNVYSSRQARGSQSNLTSIFTTSSNREREREGPRDEAALAARRETKAEREARRLEKERVARVKERERSMREESVDGGFLVTQGVYTGPEDYNKSIVRSLMVDRRLAPFWPGLEDKEDDWAEHQLVAAVHRRTPIPPADEPPAQPAHWPPADGPQLNDATPGPSSPQSASSDPVSPPGTSSSPPSAGGLLMKGRGKGVASLTVPSTARGASSSDLTQQETTLPAEPTVNGQRLEVYLYKDASECPICFLFYPPYLNRTRCCDQAICSECFVQIKRPDPHPPEHHDDPNNPTAQMQMSQEQEQEQGFGGITLVSEPAQCPYCGLPEFGITFEPPPIRRGLVYASQASSTPSPLPSPTPPVGVGGRKRAASLPASSPTVITTDKVRPEWAQKLNTARAHHARRSAAATALHAAAYMMGGRERRLPLFGRRANSSRNFGEDDGEGASSRTRNTGEIDFVRLMEAAQLGQSRGSSRQTREEEEEDKWLKEAIRQSIASEEERQRKSDKEHAKEEKKKAKDEKKAQKEAQKAARKASGSSSTLYGLMGGSRSNLTVNSVQPSMVSQESTGTPSGKGKGIARQRSNSSTHVNPDAGSSQNAGAQAHLERSRANLQPPGDLGSGRPSHLRNLSNASSSTSSLADSPDPSALHLPRTDSNESAESPGTTPIETTFNYRSLMAMIEDEEREKSAENSTSAAAAAAPTITTGDEAHENVTNAENGHASTASNGTKHTVEVTSGPMQQNVG